MNETSNSQSTGEIGASTLALLAFAQMLPATALTPAIRPLFADLHSSNDGAMHAFFALNMVGGALAAPLVVWALARGSRPRELFAVLSAIDALVVATFGLRIGTGALLSLRALDGATHVAACTLLLAVAASPGRTRSAVPAVGLGIIGAVAAGSLVGARLVGLHPRGPIWFASAAFFCVAVVGGLLLERGPIAVREKTGSPRSRRLDPGLAKLATAGTVARFVVGCLVVSFSLFGHRAHGLSDTSIGTHFALVTLPFALATWPLARLAQTRGRDGLLCAGMITMGLGCASLGWLPRGALPFAMLAIGLGSAAAFASLLAESGDGGGALERARRMATLNGAGCLGMLLGPTVAGIVSALTRSALDPARGQRIALLVGGLAPFAWALVFACLRAHERTNREDVPRLAGSQLPVEPLPVLEARPSSAHSALRGVLHPGPLVRIANEHGARDERAELGRP